jgi:hypothetical protein
MSSVDVRFRTSRVPRITHDGGWRSPNGSRPSAVCIETYVRQVTCQSGWPPQSGSRRCGAVHSATLCFYRRRMSESIANAKAAALRAAMGCQWASLSSALSLRRSDTPQTTPAETLGLTWAA